MQCASLCRTSELRFFGSSVFSIPWPDLQVKSVMPALESIDRQDCSFSIEIASASRLPLDMHGAPSFLNLPGMIRCSYKLSGLHQHSQVTMCVLLRSCDYPYPTNTLLTGICTERKNISKGFRDSVSVEGKSHSA